MHDLAISDAGESHLDERAVLEALSAAALAFTGSRHLTPVLDQLLGSVLRLLKADAGSIMLLGPDRDKFYVAAAKGPRASIITGTWQPLDQSVAGYVVREERTVLLHGPAGGGGPAQPTSAHPRDLASGVVTPLRVSGKLVGVLSASRSPGAPRMDERSIQLLELLANQAAILIDSAELVERTAEAQTKIRAVLDATSEAIALVSDDRRTLSVNRRFNELFFGGARSDLLGAELPFETFLADIDRLFADPAGLRALFEETLADPDRRLTEVIVQRAPEARELELYSTPVRDAGDQRIGRLYVFRDVSSERAAERMKTEFVHMVSHELRTPLTSINGYVDLFLDGEFGFLSDEQRQYLQVVRNNGSHLLSLINDLLDVARMTSGAVKLERHELELGSLAESVAQTLRPQVDTRKQRLSVDVPGDLPRVLGDPGRVRQILMNLVSNAHKYTPQGGSLVVSARRAGDMVRIDVVDTGIGLSAADQAQLFTRFFRADNPTAKLVGGTGLGLVITRCLVEAHGGEISLASAPGEGSTFSFTLPVAPRAAASSKR
jgi:signal transduction histidine kinase